MPFPKGQRRSPESIEKLKATLARPEVKAKMRAAKLGVSLTAEHRAKIAAGNVGRRMSEHNKAALREANKAPARPAELAAMRERSLRMWSDPAYRERLVTAHLGGPGNPTRPNAASRTRMRVAQLGKRRSLESRLKQSASASGGRHHNWKGGPIPHNHRGEGWHTIKGNYIDDSSAF